MITIDDVKQEYADVLQIIDDLSLELSKTNDYYRRRDLISKLNYWNIIQHYVLERCKSIEYSK